MRHVNKMFAVEQNPGQIVRVIDTATNLERNIVKEIMRECFPRKLKPNPNFVAYFVKLLLLDPNWDITDNFMNSRANLQRFVKYVINQMKLRNQPKFITLEMQFYFTCNLDNIGQVAEANRKDLARRLAPLKNDICKCEVSKPRDLEILRTKIVNYNILISGLGNPQEKRMSGVWLGKLEYVEYINDNVNSRRIKKGDEVYSEAAMAMNSIMNDEELRDFLKESAEDRGNLLEELSKIICGVRLFNKDSDKGGAGIEDLPNLFDAALNVLKEDICSKIEVIMHTVNTLTTAIDNCYIVTMIDGEYTVSLNIPPDVEPKHIENIKDLLILYRQYEVYARRILEELHTLEERSLKIYESFEDLLLKIHCKVYMKIAVPVRVIFPLFLELSNQWSTLQNQVVLLCKYRDIMTNLETYASTAYVNKTMLNMLVESDLTTNVERLQQTVQCSIKSINDDVQIFTSANVQNLDKIKLQFLGFCCRKMVETAGGLIPGNVSMGMARYRNMNFLFSSQEAGISFSKNPEEIIRRVYKLCREKPQLITFLQLQDQLLQVFGDKKLIEDKVVPKKMEDKAVDGVHTYDEICPPNKPKSYHWNIWSLKREALMLANVTHCKTVSTQTFKSHSMNAMKSQTYNWKECSAQTKYDNCTNVPRPSTFIFGLRARRDNHQLIMDLTRPVRE